MVLSAALDKGYIFIVLIAILTSVIAGVYYLNIVKETFFYKPEHSLLGNSAHCVDAGAEISGFKLDSDKSNKEIRKVAVEYNKIVLSSPIAFTISIITLIILLFMFINNEWLSMGTILVQILFDN